MEACLIHENRTPQQNKVIVYTVRRDSEEVRTYTVDRPADPWEVVVDRSAAAGPPTAGSHREDITGLLNGLMMDRTSNSW